MSGEETPDLFRAFGWRILTSVSTSFARRGCSARRHTRISSVCRGVCRGTRVSIGCINSVRRGTRIGNCIGSFLLSSTWLSFLCECCFLVGSSMPSFCSVLTLHVPHLWPHSSEIVSRDPISIMFVQKYFLRHSQL